MWYLAIGGGARRVGAAVAVTEWMERLDGNCVNSEELGYQEN